MRLSKYLGNLRVIGEVVFGSVLAFVLFGVVMLIAYGVAFLNQGKAEPNQENTVKPVDAVYHTRYGTVHCGQQEISPCGLILRNCTDDYVYYCLQDTRTQVRYEDELTKEGND
jgi:hypothetical protein